MTFVVLLYINCDLSIMSYAEETVQVNLVN